MIGKVTVRSLNPPCTYCGGMGGYHSDDLCPGWDWTPVASGKKRTRRTAIVERREGLADLERIAAEMSRLSTDETDDYSRFAERIRLNLGKIAPARSGEVD